jgi:multicomponent Na+:H+ antiporter subunit G
MIEGAVDYFTALLVGLGAVFSLLAALGVLRFPDALTRMHAASKAGSLGAGFLFLAAALHVGGGVSLRAIVGILFILATAPLSAHLLGRAIVRTDGKSGSADLSQTADVNSPEEQ